MGASSASVHSQHLSTVALPDERVHEPRNRVTSSQSHCYAHCLGAKVELVAAARWLVCTTEAAAQRREVFKAPHEVEVRAVWHEGGRRGIECSACVHWVRMLGAAVGAATDATHHRGCKRDTASNAGTRACPRSARRPHRPSGTASCSRRKR